MPTDDCREVIEQLKRNKKNRTATELIEILKSFGFTEHPRKSGSHRKTTKPGCETMVLIPDHGRGTVKVAYVRLTIRALEECCDD